MRILLSAALLSCLPAFAFAADEGHTELDAHEHGSGVFNVAIEGKSVAMELEAPGADIVGFEHAAHSAEDKSAIKKAKSVLADLKSVVEFPDAAGCTLAAAKLELHTEGGDHEKHDDHDHAKKAEKHDDDHDHDKKAEKHDDHDHDHAKKAEKHDDDHDHDHGKEKHADGEAEEGHTEFHAAYQLNCTSPERLKSFSFSYFKTFAGAKELQVSIAGPSGQKKLEVTRGNSKVDLAEIM